MAVDTSLVGAGAAAGTAVMPGIGTVVGAGVGLLLGSMSGGKGTASQAGPQGPSSAAVAVYGSGLSGDNWSVNFGGQQTNTPTAYKPFSATGPTASTAAGQGAVMPAGGGLPQVPSWAWVALAGVIAWRALKSHK